MMVFVDGAISTVDFLSIGESESSINRYGASKLHIATSVQFEYEWNDVLLEASAKFDILPNSLYLVYESNVPIQVDFFKDDTYITTYTLASTGGFIATEVVELPMGSLCKSFRFKVKGTAALVDAAQPFLEISEIGEDHSVIPAGGELKRF
jgi:hypothetical protein